MWWAISVAVRSVIVPSSASSAAATWSDGSIALPTSCRRAASRNSSSYPPLGTGELEDLQAMVERVPLGVVLRVLLDPFQRLQQQPVHLETVDVVLDPLDVRVEIDLGVLLAEKGLELGDRVRSIAWPVIELLKT